MYQLKNNVSKNDFLEGPDMGESRNSGKYYNPWISRNRLNNFDRLEQNGIQRTTLTYMIKQLFCDDLL